MKIKYFTETDTLYMELTSKEVAESIDLNENMIVDLDSDGNVVAITLEHAQKQANISEFSFQQITTSQPQAALYQPS